jgi:hypothetical protein
MLLNDGKLTSDPSLWSAPCRGYNPLCGPDETLKALGYTRKSLLALAIIRDLRNTVVQNKLSLFVVVDGRHRAGKSLMVFTLSWLISRSFKKNPARYIVKNAEDLLALIPQINQEKIYNPVIIIDEAGSSLNSSDWQERVMRAVIKTLAVIGYLHPTIFFIAPLKSQILKGIRDMCHVYIKVNRSNNNYAIVTPYTMQSNSLMNKVYAKKFKIHFFGQPIKINSIHISLPPKDLQEMYSKIELERKPLMLQDIRSDITRLAKPTRKKIVDVAGICKQITDDAVIRKSLESKTSKPDNMKLNANLIAQKFQVSMVNAQTIKSILEKG